jgi:hypothetical protein
MKATACELARSPKDAVFKIRAWLRKFLKLRDVHEVSRNREIDASAAKRPSRRRGDSGPGVSVESHLLVQPKDEAIDSSFLKNHPEVMALDTAIGDFGLNLYVVKRVVDSA